MRSLLRYDEEAHRPELYLEEQDESWSHLPPIPLPPAGTGASESGAGRGSSLSGASESPSIGDDDGGEVSTRGTSRYHRQLRRYREHLVEEVSATSTRSSIITGMECRTGGAKGANGDQAHESESKGSRSSSILMRNSRDMVMCLERPRVFQIRVLGERLKVLVTSPESRPIPDLKE